MSLPNLIKKIVERALDAQVSSVVPKSVEESFVIDVANNTKLRVSHLPPVSFYICDKHLMPQFFRERYEFAPIPANSKYI